MHHSSLLCKRDTRTNTKRTLAWDNVNAFHNAEAAARGFQNELPKRSVVLHTRGGGAPVASSSFLFICTESVMEKTRRFEERKGLSVEDERVVLDKELF